MARLNVFTNKPKPIAKNRTPRISGSTGMVASITDPVFTYRALTISVDVAVDVGDICYSNHERVSRRNSFPKSYNIFKKAASMIPAPVHSSPRP